MIITRVSVRLTKSSTQVLAFATIVFDDSFCVNDLKVIQGDNSIFVVLPDKEAKIPCSNQCGNRNGVTANFCSRCGTKLVQKSSEIKRYQYVCHPVVDELRLQIQEAVIKAYFEKVGTS